MFVVFLYLYVVIIYYIVNNLNVMDKICLSKKIKIDSCLKLFFSFSVVWFVKSCVRFFFLFLILLYGFLVLFSLSGYCAYFPFSFFRRNGQEKDLWFWLLIFICGRVI